MATVGGSGSGGGFGSDRGGSSGSGYTIPYSLVIYSFPPKKPHLNENIKKMRRFYD